MKKLISIVLILLTSLFFINNVSASDVNSALVDNSGVFSTNQGVFLSQYLNKMATKTKIDMHLITIDSLDSVSQQSAAIKYIEEYYRTNYGDPYARNTEDVVIILLATNNTIGQYKRWAEISCYGEVDRHISNDDAYDLTGVFVNFDESDPNCWFERTTMLLEDMYDLVTFSQMYNMIIPHVIILVIALIFGGLTIFYLVFSFGAKKTVSNETYMLNNSGKLLGRYDRYINTITTRVPVSSSSSSGGYGGGGGGGRSSGGGRGF